MVGPSVVEMASPMVATMAAYLVASSDETMVVHLAVHSAGAMAGCSDDSSVDQMAASTVDSMGEQ